MTAYPQIPFPIAKKSESIEIEVIIKPCPWCKKTPQLYLPLYENIGGTWLWKIGCESSDCLVNPVLRPIAIRRTTKTNIDRLKDKIVMMVTKWNYNNPCEAYEKIKVIPDEYNKFLKKLAEEKNGI